MSVPVGRYGLVTGRSYLMRRAGGPDPNAEFAGQVPVIVTVDRLDHFCAREAISRVDFVKIDVEGAELQVLEGGKEVIEAYRPTMLIEIEARHTARYGHAPEDVAGWLLKRGYGMHAWQRGWREVDRVEHRTSGTTCSARWPPHPWHPAATLGKPGRTALPDAKGQSVTAEASASEEAQSSGPRERPRQSGGAAPDLLVRPCSRGMLSSPPSSLKDPAVAWGVWAAAGLRPRRGRRPGGSAGLRSRS